ncbi:MAG TPA: hypothetical protein DHU85_04590 [Porphyromonadaceae bacterium]|jgi:hypothetical protein|uniref:Winged helix-turn-helix domain-containing protein n=1 Tax=Candidatus Caccoplasma intestinavium TaxID=2840716 RepID=A0A9D1KD53_9BACT|nr:winged helix-turn-helix domain-containing protein [Coprobacter sp.]CDA22351.1 putative uncharacterized protein [Bacteroides sp. CAG:144]HCZ20784.1 hypothetical protein [Porphyromonadaceae bacterium]HIT40093.1 winged helix-turn-helix domain-containing protein [Candidatus Caccoplasma intestinavium]
METAKIGLNAGLVWRKLNENGSFPIQELARKLDLGAEDTALAIGWLARENKVYLERKNGVLYVKNS